MPLPSNYTSTVPQGTQQINNTQQPINYNFQDISALLAVNHVGFNTADTFGTHNFSNFVTQTIDPTTAAAEMALYTKAVTGDTNGIELFYRYPSNGSVLQLTGSTASSGSTGSGGGLFTNNQSYSSVPGSGIGQPFSGSWQYLSNGILMMTWQVGNGYEAGSNGSTSPMTVYIPNSSNCYTTAGSSTMPTFTTAIYNFQMSATNPQGSPLGNPYANNAITIVNTTTALLYWQGTASTDAGGGGGQGSVMVTAIGI